MLKLVFAAAVSLLAQSAAENAADADRLAAVLRIHAGSSVCEVGAGSGELTVLLAKTAGLGGHVFSNELNADRRAEIARAAESAGLSNVTVVEGQADAANFADASCDVLFMRNVYHHFARPSAMDATLLRAVKPGGRIAVMDFAPTGGESPDPAGRAKEPYHGVSPASVIRELGEAGFTDLSSETVRGHAFMVVGTRPGAQSGDCHQSPSQDSLPGIVGPMLGVRPAWLVDGSGTWRDGGAVKTLWVLLRTSKEVRITGRRLDGPGVVTLRREADPPVDMLVIADPGRQSAIPGGATPEVMRTYSFLPSHVFYPTPGCWEFTVRIGEDEVRIVRDLKPAAGFE
jgi:ubiquinone/menaquinone biosynthesis C-methylase UbiE